MKKLVLMMIATLVVWNAHASAGKRKKEDRKLLDRVAVWQINNYDRVKHHDLDWTNGALFRGMVEWADYTGDQRYYDFLLNIGKRNDWGFLKRVYHADDLCIGQLYLNLYRKFRQPEMIAKTAERVHYLIENPSEVRLWHGVKGGSDRWSWCDALFMAPPVFVELYNIEKESRILEFVDREFKLTTDSLYSSEDALYYRDRTFKGRQEANGTKIFWGRGNGWVLAGLALMLEHLPKEHPTYGYYRQIFCDMSEAVIRCQDANGSWRASLYDPQSYPLAENSGSSFFVYGLSWGVNNGVLKDEKFKTAAIKGWNALKTYVDEDGKLGCIQQIGAAPGRYDPTQTEVYGVGAFLLAGIQMQQMKY